MREGALTDERNASRLDWATEMFTVIGLGLDSGVIDMCAAKRLLATLGTCLSQPEREGLLRWHAAIVRWYDRTFVSDGID